MYICCMFCWRDFCFFFFKQKTAYEMRISDWSSDVCSSNLSFGRGYSRPPTSSSPMSPSNGRMLLRGMQEYGAQSLDCAGKIAPRSFSSKMTLFGNRSEEHTSELQSLMRTSYAVFCLKTKSRNTPASRE